MPTTSTNDHKDLYEGSPLRKRFSAKERSIHLPRLEQDYVEAFFHDKDKAVLDGGCGSGRISFALEEKGYCNIMAYDFAVPLLEDARELAQLRNSKARFYQANACQLEQFPNASFDYIIYSAHLLSLIPMPAQIQALLEVRRLLRVGGVAVMSALNRRVDLKRRIMLKGFALRNYLLKENFSPIELPYVRLGRQWNLISFLRDGPTVTWYVQSEIRDLVEACGLKVLQSSDTERMTGGPRSISIMLACSRNDS